MKAVVALGANLDDPQGAIELAVALLREATEVIAVSSLYKTKPVGGPEQPDYFNAICIIESEVSATDFLHMLQGIEKSMGRIRVERWGPRIIDLDLITFGDIQSSDPHLTLPHPRAHERRFVLEPWLEIEPTAHLVGRGLIEQILEELPPSQ